MTNIEKYIPKEKRKKILLLSDDIRMTSGISTMAREIVIGTSPHFNWVNLAGSIQHPDKGKKLDLSSDTNNHAGIDDSSVVLYPTDGYGNADIIRQLLSLEKPDAIMFFTDPRYWIWLFNMEHEIRQKIPMIYLNIWDDLPYPMYNKSFYESCDALMAISKQTENINRVVLGESAKEKIIKYVPHGINEKHFFPINDGMTEYLTLIDFKKQLFNGKEYDFVLLFNARNIRRKCVTDLMLAWKIFTDDLSETEKSKCALILHTQPIDENGTNLEAVAEMIYGNDEYNVIISPQRFSVNIMNLLYNSVDVVILPSSNEGWGLSLTEGMMCGKQIIATVTGGMQDQMRFVDENNNIIKFTEEFGSNHRGKYKECGEWAYPVFANNISLVGSVPTPYIYDDKCSPEDISLAIYKAWLFKVSNPELFKEVGLQAHEWVKSDESMMSARWMCKNVVDAIDETFDKFEPRYKWELIETSIPEQPKHYNKFVITK